jgi:DNA-binding ferritin-like protein
MIVTNLLTLHNQLKIHHWQTKSYAEHQALGSAYNEFSELIDEFVEVFMGKYGRIERSNYKDISAADFVDKYIDYLINELPKSLEETDTDLFNIRDEMLAQLHKLKYLLTLS